MDVTSSQTVSIRPYPGLDSFQWRDRRRFFGRTADSARLQAQVSDKNLSLLHAPSGAGKTSLINAGLIAPLEYEQLWLACVVRPGQDPLREVAAGTLRRIFPDPLIEVSAIDALLDASAWLTETGREEVLSAKSSLLEARQRMDSVSAELDDDARSSRLMALRASEFLARAQSISDESAGGLDGVRDGASFFQKFLEYPSGRRVFVRHLAWISSVASKEKHFIPWPEELEDAIELQDLDEFGRGVAGMSLSTLRALFSSREMLALHADFSREYLGVLDDQDEAALRRFLHHLSENALTPAVFGCEPGVRAGPPPSIAIVIDQFEEVFTQLDYASRENFFDQLEKMYSHADAAESELNSLSKFHILISMRDEYVADLDRIRQFSKDLSQKTFHLGFIPAEEIELVIRRPAEQFGFEVDDGVINKIVEDLRLENDTVEPALVQIVLSNVWRRLGLDITQTVENDKDARLSEDSFGALGTTEEIMSRHIRDVVADAAMHGGETDDITGKFRQFELLDMLDQLTRRGDYRAILSEEELVRPIAVRDRVSSDDAGPVSNRRERMLEYAASHGLVRRYRQKGHGGASKLREPTARTIVEVTHERLIPGLSSMLNEFLRSDGPFRDLQSGRARLQNMTVAEARRSSESLFDNSELASIARFADLLELDSDSVECLFRSAVLIGSDDAIKWAEKFALQANSIDVRSRLRLAKDDIVAKNWLDRVELLALKNEGWPIEDDVEFEFVLRSLMSECIDGDDELIMAFSKETSGA